MLDEVEQAGISMSDVTHQLEVDGVAAFSESFDSLLQTIQERLGAAGRSAA